ncbi:MAG: hypothetical protein AB7K37_15425 [Cyclobacteriaceae bacterium]
MKNSRRNWVFIVFVHFGFCLMACTGSSQNRIDKADKIISLTQELVQNKDLGAVKIFTQSSMSSMPQRVYSLDSMNDKRYNYMYNVVFRENKVIALIGVPFIESGDYRVTVSHYFDRDGNTIAYKKKITFFDSNCSEDPLVSEKVVYYDKKGGAVLKKEQLRDVQGRALKNESECVLNFSYPDKVFLKYSQIPFSETLAKASNH